MNTDIDFSEFPAEREQKLKDIYRFSLFETFFYRSNLWMHTHRVFWLIEELLPVAQKYLQIDPEKTRVLALVHDDAEMITGDHQAGTKARMSTAELSQLDNEEEQAIGILSEKFPKQIHGYSYKELLLEALNKDSVEAQLVSYADKIDAQCESLHEVLAGNISALRSIMFYTCAFALFPKKLPKLEPLFENKESPLTYLTDVTTPEKAFSNNFIHLNKPHTEESLTKDTDFPFYNTWRRLVLEKGGNEGKSWLLAQRERF